MTKAEVDSIIRDIDDTINQLKRELGSGGTYIFKGIAEGLTKDWDNPTGINVVNNILWQTEEINYNLALIKDRLDNLSSPTVSWEYCNKIEKE